MARTPSMTRAECEARIGPRGALKVTVENRREVRKWIVACGGSSALAGGMSLAALEQAYNDTSDSYLRNTVWEAPAPAPRPETPTPSPVKSGFTQAELEAQIKLLKRAEVGPYRDLITGRRHPDAQNPYTAPINIKAWEIIVAEYKRNNRQGTQTMEDEQLVINVAEPAPEQQEQTQRIPDAPVGDSVTFVMPGMQQPMRPGIERVLARSRRVDQATGAAPTAEQQEQLRALEALQGLLRPQTDLREVERIVRENSLTADQIKELVKEEAPKHVQVQRVELVQQDGSVTAIEGAVHPMFAKLLKAATARQADGYHPNIWISGPAGAGKTRGAHDVARALGLEFYYNGALSMPHELLGFIDAGGTYHITPFREAYTKGGVYLFDEVDGSDNSALLALNAALANGRASFPNGAEERHKDNVIIATANTWGLGGNADYVGRARIDAAFLSRFPVRIFWDYNEDLEKAISGHEGFAKRVQKARAKARSAGLKVLIDPRASIAGAALIAQGFTEKEAAEMTYLANLSPEQRNMVEA